MEREEAHDYTTGKDLGFQERSRLYDVRVCRKCGMVKPENGKITKCRGKIGVSLRAGAEQA